MNPRPGLREHGRDSITYSTHQDGLSYFETDHGYIAYSSVSGIDITLGPPVCAPSDRAALASAFLRKSRRPVFFYVDEEIARLVGEIAGGRMFAAGIGIEKVVSASSDLAASNRIVASACRKARKHGFEIEEVRLPTLSADRRAKIGEITRHYLQSSPVTVEMRFINRPFDFTDAGPSRTFLLLDRGELFGYAVCDPYYESGRTKGYLLNLIRFMPTKIWGLYYAVVAELCARLAAESVPELSLGYMPLCHVDTAPGLVRSRLLEAQLGWIAAQFSGVHYLARLREMKTTLEGRAFQRYVVSPSHSVHVPLFAMLRASGFSISSLVGAALSRR